MIFDYVLDVYYGEQYIMTLAARHCADYDNVVWYEVKKLIDTLKNKEITKENILSFINNNETYFKECTDDCYTRKEKIDFKNQTITIPTKPIYSIDEFNDVWEGFAQLVEVDNKLYVKYDDEEVYPLKNITFEDESLLLKDVITFDEFNILYEFYDKLQDEDNEYLLNNHKIIKFNII